MDNVELVAGVLIGAEDPKASAAVLAQALRAEPRASLDLTRELGLDEQLVDVLRSHFTRQPHDIDRACSEAAAWILGRRSVEIDDPWDLVVTLPPGARFPQGLERSTGETLLHLITGATGSVRLIAPFIDQQGLGFLSDALAGATNRGARVEILLPTRSTHAPDALGELVSYIEEQGRADSLEVATFRTDAPWAHLKVLTVDGAKAYVGSANVTGPGLVGANLEMGVLVRGPKGRSH